MFDLDRWEEIWNTLSRNKMRSFMTSMGVFWAIVLLVVMLGAGIGMRNMLMSNITVSKNSAFVMSRKTSVAYKGYAKGRYWSMKFDDISALKHRIPGVKYITRNIGSRSEMIINGENSYEAYVEGLEVEHQKVDPVNMLYGRFINDLDIARERSVCLIGKSLYKTLFPDGGDVTGQNIQIGANMYNVVGVIDANNNGSTIGDVDNMAIIPLSTMITKYNLSDRIYNFGFTADAGFGISEVEDNVTERLKALYDIAPDDNKALMVINVEEQFQALDSLFSGIETLIWIVGIGTLLAGIVGVSNIMLIVIKERTQEIGVRRALGATPRDIITQIMTESFVLTFVTGVMALGFSVTILSLAENLTDGTRLQISFELAIVSATIVISSGLLAGIIPAIRAISIKAVDAIREE